MQQGNSAPGGSREVGNPHIQYLQVTLALKLSVKLSTPEKGIRGSVQSKTHGKDSWDTRGRHTQEPVFNWVVQWCKAWLSATTLSSGSLMRPSGMGGWLLHWVSPTNTDTNKRAQRGKKSRGRNIKKTNLEDWGTMTTIRYQKLHPSIDPYIHFFSYAHPGLGRGGSSLTKDAQTFLSPANYSSLSGGNTKAFPGQLRDLISQACPGSALGPPSSRIFPEHLNQELPRSHPSQMSEPLQLAPFDVEVQ